MTPEAETILLNKLTTVIRDLHEQGADDGEAMFMLGAGADYLCQTAGVAAWPELKARLGSTEKLGLLAQIDKEGQAANAEGKVKLAYALQILGLSVTATAAESPHVHAAASLLDDLIVPALANYRKHATRN
jgi:hypothetical protein